MTGPWMAVDVATQVARHLRSRWRFGIRLPKDCRIGRNVFIAGNVRIGPGVNIEDNVILDGNISIGTNCHVYRFTEMRGNISLGENCVVGSFAILSTARDATIRIGTQSYINSYNVLGANAAIDIGDNCIFAAFVQITDASHGIDDPSIATRHSASSAAPVRVGDNVWLGSGVMVMMGSSIGNDSVVGAQSLVRGDLPERSISFGTPAIVHRIRE
jgi:acetyltransferase-like isoleucine patch superfamily enzyme